MKYFISILVALFIGSAAVAQTNSGLATPAPCSAFGTTTGTCLQGAGALGTPASGSAANLTNYPAAALAGTALPAAIVSAPGIIGSPSTTTPTPTPASGAFTAATASVTAIQFTLPSGAGHLNFVTVVVNVTAVNTAAGQMFVTVPVSAAIGTACAAIYNSNGSVNMVSQISGATVSIIPTAGVISNGSYFAQCNYQSS